MTTIATTTTTTPPTIDAGVALHSPSTELMRLVNIHNVDDRTTTTTTDFTTITNYLEKHLYDIIHEIHHTYNKLLIDDGQVQINCPPLNEDELLAREKHIATTPTTNDHRHPHAGSTLLLRTLSEKELTRGGIIAKREIKVYDCGRDETQPPYRTILIREDIVQASHNVEDTHPILTEQSVTVRIVPPAKMSNTYSGVQHA